MASSTVTPNPVFFFLIFLIFLIFHFIFYHVLFSFLIGSFFTSHSECESLFHTCCCWLSSLNGSERHSRHQYLQIPCCSEEAPRDN